MADTTNTNTKIADAARAFCSEITPPDLGMIRASLSEKQWKLFLDMVELVIDADDDSKLRGAP